MPPDQRPTVAVALLTRDLRLADNPVLAAAAAAADVVVPLFCLDPDALATSSPNRRHALATALADLRDRLRERGGDLVVRAGRPAEVLHALAADLALTQVHVARDSSAFAAQRLAAVRAALPAGVDLAEHDAHFLVAPGAVTTTTGTAYRVFTPYWRAWREAPRRPLVDPPGALRLPPGLEVGDLPSPAALADGDTSPQLVEVSEAAAERRARAFLADDADDYATGHDDLSGERTSRLSPHLHFGTLSARWLEEQLDLGDQHEPAGGAAGNPGHEALHRQLAWRDHAHQLLAAHPGFTNRDFRPRGDRWRDDPEALQAWKDGRTGYPLVDAGMRQLLATGWMHNRARMTVASFLAKHLRIDWREGAAHFRHWLVDHDVASNAVNWQWTAGTGTDSRPNRVLSPIRQAERFDPRARYIRRWVPELAQVADDLVAREPWRDDAARLRTGYPARIVDHDEARQRFLDDRGA